MDLLENAIPSIRVGVEDYLADSSARLLSAARNIHAGILLLFKEKLYRLSPDDSNAALIMSKIVPEMDSNGEISFVGQGTQTVKTSEIRERFKSLEISADWKRFEKISRVRNEVEHFYPKLTQDALKGLIADSFLIIREFIQVELGEEPYDLLGEETWQAMLQVSAVYEEEQKLCTELLGQVDWQSTALTEGIGELACKTCGSQLLRPREKPDSVQDSVLLCGSCGATEDSDSFVPRAVALALKFSAYSSIKDGGYTPYVDCPECGVEAYVIEENRCASCGTEISTVCSRCSGEILPEELDCAPMCGWCAHVSSKDD